MISLASHGKLVAGSRQALKGEIRTQEDGVKRKLNGKHCFTSPLPTFSSKPPVDFYKPATHKVKPLMKGDQPVNEQSTDVGGSHTQRLPSVKVMSIIIKLGIASLTQVQHAPG